MKKFTKIGLLIMIVLTILRCQSIDPEYLKEIEEYQKAQNDHFANPYESPLTKEDLEEFNGLDFFSINDKYRIEAKFVRIPDEKPFEMPTTTERKPVYLKYGEAHFKIGRKNLKLSIYQNQDLIKNEEYKDYLFLPFKDLTNGKKSYGGGRFFDLKIPDNEIIVIDFNKAYNPYCAYNHIYSCPIPPVENHLDIEINAGVKAFQGH